MQSPEILGVKSPRDVPSGGGVFFFFFFPLKISHKCQDLMRLFICEIWGKKNTLQANVMERLVPVSRAICHTIIPSTIHQELSRGMSMRDM